MQNHNIIFGPIHSRRFGVSLGVDLSPTTKQCNFDCLYCELAPAATVKKQNQITPVQQIITELQKHLDETIDVITLTANGEPTLYPYLQELIEQINTIKGDKETLILTNSATLNDEQVFHALLKLDQVKLSLDAVSPEIFKKIDRPDPSVDIEQIPKKVVEFSQRFHGKLFLETLFVDGLNNTKEEITKLNDLFLHIEAVSRIDIGTIDRPPAYPVQAISYTALHEIAMQFDNSLPIHIASRVHAKPHKNSYTKEEIINTLDKRPLTQEDIELLFDETSKAHLQELLANGKITTKKGGNVPFFIPAHNLKRKRLSYSHL